MESQSTRLGDTPLINEALADLAEFGLIEWVFFLGALSTIVPSVYWTATRLWRIYERWKLDLAIWGTIQNLVLANRIIRQSLETLEYTLTLRKHPSLMVAYVGRGVIIGLVRMVIGSIALVLLPGVLGQVVAVLVWLLCLLQLWLTLRFLRLQQGGVGKWILRERKSVEKAMNRATLAWEKPYPDPVQNQLNALQGRLNELATIADEIEDAWASPKYELDQIRSGPSSPPT